MIKKAVDISKLGPTLKNRLMISDSYKEKAQLRGVAGNQIVEPRPNFIQSESEKVVSGHSNASVVLGRDRPASRFSGYGGRGDTHASSIDIVVGRMGPEAQEVDTSGEPVWTDPSFTNDAARIYISQKSDVDNYFKLADGSIGNKTARSSITLKADDLRIVGREGVKIVTKTDSKNSQGGTIDSIKGIDLIAGNDDRDLQPFLKGDNTAEALSTVVDNVKDLTSLVENFITAQMKMNAVNISHVHIGNLGFPTVPSVELAVTGITTTLQHTIQSLLKMPLHRTNMESFKLKYLEPFSDKYIKSRHNNTN